MLRRIEAVNPAINAVCFVDADQAMAAARASEERWYRGQPIGPLDGVPATLKDHIQAAFRAGTRARSPATRSLSRRGCFAAQARRTFQKIANPSRRPVMSLRVAVENTNFPSGK
jgi:hypothetical protein